MSEYTRNSNLFFQSNNIPKPAVNSNEEFTMRVLTLNCWGVWLGARKRRQRMDGIVRYLRGNNCDIVFLQEIWVATDFEIIKNGTKDLYCFAHLFRSGSVLGSSGIVILCKWFPKLIHFEPYSLNGSPFYPWHGDWFAGKGIAYTRVDFDGLSLHLLSTHTHAYYKENEPVHDQYSVHRVCQSYQLAKFINFISDTACNRSGGSGKDLLVVAGDMNSTSSELPYKILTSMAGLTDCFKASRYTNHSSNIIHKHKILSYMQRLYYVDNASVSSSNSQKDLDSGNETASCSKAIKLSENFLLDTLANYRAKISQTIFDSDTDDEDITYCHPKNSFTPGVVFDNKTKPPNSSANTTASIIEQDNNSTTTSTSSSSNLTISGTTNAKNENISNFERNSSGLSSTKQMLDNSSLKKSQRSKNSPMKRIDFILCRLLTHGHCVVDRIASESKDPTLNCSISDHEPVMVELKICDISHDLIRKNHIENGSSNKETNEDQRQKVNHQESTTRPLASVLESKVSIDDACDIEETTNQWVPEKVPVNLSYHESNLKIMEETQSILKQYIEYNRKSKTQLFYIVLFMFIITLPTTTYYALINELLPISTVVFMWFAASIIFAAGLLVGFLSYRFEQGAIEAILNDMKTLKKASSNTMVS